MRRLACLLPALAALACGSEIDPAELAQQRPYLVGTIDTAPPAGATSKLPKVTQNFGLSTTLSFDNICRFAAGGLQVSARADEAPKLVFELGPWKSTSANKYGVACLDDAADCKAELAVLRWDAEDGRFDAQPARKSDGLSEGTKCSATFVADALDATQSILEGSCENLLGSFTRAGEKPVFGPVKVTFRALCQRP